MPLWEVPFVKETFIEDNDTSSDDEDKVKVRAEQVFLPISEWTLQKNEWLDQGKSPSDCPPYSPKRIVDNQASKKEHLEDEEKEFDWFKQQTHAPDSYFCQINRNRRTMQAGEELYISYGRRTNKFLLLNYGFCFPGNRYDSYEVCLRRDASTEQVEAHALVDLDWTCDDVEKVRLKKDQICRTLVNFLRAICKKSFFVDQPSRRVLIGQPTYLLYE